MDTISAITQLSQSIAELGNQRQEDRKSGRTVRVAVKQFEPRSVEARGRSGPWKRQKLPEEPGLVEQKVTHLRFRHASSCRTYRLMWDRPVDTFYGKVVKKNLTKRAIHMGGLSFDGTDRIRIAHFFNKLADVEDTQVVGARGPPQPQAIYQR